MVQNCKSQEKFWKIHKYMELKHYTEQATDEQRNQRRTVYTPPQSLQVTRDTPVVMAELSDTSVLF